MTDSTYKRLTSKIMMGKRGLVRSVNSLRVDGSMKMVISVCREVEPGTIEIPVNVSKSIKVPVIVDGRIEYHGIKDGDWGLLVRQPCLWPGGIQPVRIRVTDPIYVRADGHKWNTNWTIRFVPPHTGTRACYAYGTHLSVDR
jgi:1-acyl-sn-glycerol-3-phosphate acyltransferase